MICLTPFGARVLEAIAAIEAEGKNPTPFGIATRLNVRKSGVHSALRSLTQQGFIVVARRADSGTPIYTVKREG